VPGIACSDMSSEDQLCLLLASGGLSPDREQRARELLAGPLDWQRFYARAIAQEVLPLVHRNLRGLGFPGVPDDVRQRMAAAFRSNAIRNLALARELARLLRVLAESGIPIMPVKGVVLSQRLYGDLALRPTSDIDLFLPAQATVRAVRVLAGVGYAGPFPERRLSRWFLRHSVDYPLFGAASANGKQTATVELHWRLHREESINRPMTADLWAEARPTEWLGAPALGLSPEWEFIHLCLHAGQHQWRTLKWLADIHELCCCRPPDWRRVREKVGRFGLLSPVETTLSACHRLLGTFDDGKLPAGFRLAPLPRGVVLFPAPALPYAALRTAVHYSWLALGLWAKLRCLAEWVFTPTLAECQAVSLPPSLSFLYYPLRPVRLTLKWSYIVLTQAAKSLWGWRPGVPAGLGGRQQPAPGDSLP